MRSLAESRYASAVDRESEVGDRDFKFGAASLLLLGVIAIVFAIVS